MPSNRQDCSHDAEEDHEAECHHHTHGQCPETPPQRRPGPKAFLSPLNRVRHKQVALRLLDALSSRLQETRTKLEETAFLNATTRVCRALLRLARDTSELSGLTHQELADATGLYRETVTMALNRLQAQGLVELGKKKIIILDRTGLERVAEI